jgi:hypothetical protein
MNSIIPILLLVFNRPSTTQAVFDSIKKIKPAKLYISQDWPRNQKDEKLIQEVRKIFVIDRECDVQYLYRNSNLWCRDAVVWWIDWFFHYEKFGIILEDDCIMWSQFPEFCLRCDELYTDNSIIWSISGSNYIKETRDTSWDYFFTSHHPLLRWRATRKDRRHNYQHDIHISSIDQNTRKSHYKNYKDCAIKRYWKWWYRDSNWYSLLRNNHLLTIVPTVNLITNVGHIWIHNQRAWSFHDLPYDSFDHSIAQFQTKELSINQKYDAAMENFIFKLYFYTKIEILLKKSWIYSAIHRTFLSFISLLQKLWLK